MANKNLIPGDTPADLDAPSGLRMGTIEVTRLGMREKEMEQIAEFISKCLWKNARPKMW